MTVGELLGRISSRELSEWMAYERVTGPLGPERADLHAAIVASTVANANRGKRGRAAKPADFIPRWDRREQSWQEQLATVQRINTALGGSQTG
ncbi:DUF4035 domain-containing protein [Lipingzhangella sp. LS1_29]|uniref:DUF4035 domain-containing protein n=1 Tax=Lipingzhangella rawalii TaxID=2055835 RepID=A0ABU2H4D4_9ACTN|nr:DUF4035 domain-containing protein [Lipingzhangella rawalii]MDS1269690.1 DUF4035 domain-containing protein [Lipingzhangella rawalii]